MWQKKKKGKDLQNFCPINGTMAGLAYKLASKEKFGWKQQFANR
jgi:hypothetical protein